MSEAATTALDHLARGYEVELVTRDQALGFAGGARQRLAVLEALALVQPRPRGSEPLASSDPRAPQLRVHLDADLADGPEARAMSFGRQKRLLLGWLALLAPSRCLSTTSCAWPAVAASICSACSLVPAVGRAPIGSAGCRSGR